MKTDDTLLFRNVFQAIFNYRYLISLVIILLIIGLGIYLYTDRNWGFKDAAQVCTGFFIVITLFFTALNYEFTHSKMKQDYKAARELLTFNTANEWHKAPLKDYQKVSIGYENQFIASKSERTADDFEAFINDSERIEFKESLKGLLNYFESVSIASYRGLIDKNFIREFYRSIFEIYYIDYYFYIQNHRIKKNNDKIWVNFTNLVEEWHPGIREEMMKKPIKSTIIT